jgi:hypothetical protein
MSKFSRGFFAASAIALTLGIVPLAAGRDLAGGVFDRLQAPASPSAINRSAKADRITGAVAPASPATRTISLQLDGLANTSVLVRIPLVPLAQAGRGSPEWTKTGKGRLAACEPVVSVLTDIAKRLQPGRCVT